MSKIKVLMIVPNLQVANGVASFVMNYLRNLDHNAVQIDIVSYEEGSSPYYSEVKSFGGNVYFLPSIKKLPLHIKMCNQILNEGQYSVIHDNTLHISIPMMWCAKRKGVPVRILHSHSSKLSNTVVKEIRNRAFLPVLKSISTDYVACSNIAGKTMFGNKYFTVIPNVVHAEKFKFAPSNRELIRSKMNVTSKFVIGTVGRMSIEKNPYFAIDIFKKLLNEIPNAEYWWVGSGPLDSAIKDYVSEQGLTDKVRLLGSRDDVALLYQGMDAFFLPSKFEGLGLVCLEAQAAGLPCIVSDSVPAEVNITHEVIFIPLKVSKDEWATSFVNLMSARYNRNDGYICLKNSAFSDDKTGTALYSYYQKVIRKHDPNNEVGK